MRARQKSPGVGHPGQEANKRGGRSFATHNDSMKMPAAQAPVLPLSDLRRQYNSAILAKDWAAAERLQRAYHAAERERRRELLQQARDRGQR